LWLCRRYYPNKFCPTCSTLCCDVVH
jgi:hypothetical protein